MENRAWESQAGQAGGEMALEAAELLAAAAEAVRGEWGGIVLISHCQVSRTGWGCTGKAQLEC